MNTDLKLALSLGLSEEEWEYLKSQLERLPSFEELQMIAVMWSEHCSYKSSKFLLKRLHSAGDQVLQGPGENAGLVAWGEDQALAFKIESHNHPSFVEPFQGAATGVGGILRDIFTMGARPVALANYLRFGNLRLKNQQRLLDGVVSGISHYGNCMGIPMLGGQVQTDPCYDHNILVNVFALGVLDRSKLFRSNSAKPGAKVMIWGAPTGRDGIHGASLLASAEFEAESGQDREQKIRVQVGDPFREKLLMEACLECMSELSDELLAIQDMGAAGLTCSTMEIADKSRLGMKIDLDKVPVREEGMQAFELLLSESQERMLAVVQDGQEEKFRRILHKWGCVAECIGETTAEPTLKMSFQGEPLVNLPVSQVMEPPKLALEVQKFEVERPAQKAEIQDVREEWQVLKYLLALPGIASKRGLFRQYDSTVGAASVQGPGGEAGVLWLPQKNLDFAGAAFKGAWDEVVAEWNPFLAAQLAITECARSLACVGARPIGLTDGVNLGNPNNPKVLSQFEAIIEAMNEGMKAFNAPCVSGNVSLFNQTKSEAGSVDIFPTVFIVMLGEIEDVRKCRPKSFQESGNDVWLLEAKPPNLEMPFGSLYARRFWPEHQWRGDWPEVDWQAEKSLVEALIKAHEDELFVSVRDVADGGLAVALAEACVSGEKPFGFDGDWSTSQKRRDLLLFGEFSGRVVVEIRPEQRASFLKLSREYQLHSWRLGKLTDTGVFRLRPLCQGPVEELKAAWESCFPV
ncbi:MAG: phosphoribosylformylglycinamidine synthase subunit PurL [Bradymonadales bacterium]|nr:MAG: phosphoribosylformylglycinamidine synthase subunit PurL [Bradymonadales bacterium]